MAYSLRVRFDRLAGSHDPALPRDDRTIFLRPTPADSARQLEDLQVLEQNQAKLLGPLRSRCWSTVDPGDAFGDFAVAFLRSRRSFDPSRGTEFTTYARVAIGHAVFEGNRFESKSRARESKTPGLSPVHTILTEAELSTVNMDGEEVLASETLEAPDDPALNSAEYPDVREFVAALPRRQRQVAALVYWEGYSPAEAARVLGISRAAVNNLLRKIQDKGRQALSGYA